MKNSIERRTDGAGRRAALYVRVSSEEQARHGLSLEAQRETLVQYAKDNGLRIVSEYHDEGYTARKSYKSRPQFMRMLADVEKEKFDLILFIKLDRWFRNVADYYEIQRILDAHHVSWIATEEDYDTTTANGRLHLNIKLSIAQDEADRTSERIKFVFDSKLRRGEVISGKVPFGYKIENKRLVLDEEKASVVQDIFDHYLSLLSVSALRKYVMQTYGIVYSHQGLRYLLTYEQYIGRAHGQPDFCPPIIDLKTFTRVQELLQERSQRQVRSDRVYLFTSIAFCAECGNRLSAHTVDRKYIYYRCTRYEHLALCPHKHRTSERILEDWLLKNFLSECAKYNLQVTAAVPEQEKKDLSKVKRKMEKLKDLYLNDLIELDVYEKEYASLRAELDVPQEVEPPKPVDLEAIKEALPLYNSLSRDRQKAFWASMIKSITITNNDEFLVTPISP